MTQCPPGWLHICLFSPLLSMPEYLIHHSFHLPYNILMILFVCFGLQAVFSCNNHRWNIITVFSCNNHTWNIITVFAILLDKRQWMSSKVVLLFGATPPAHQTATGCDCSSFPHSSQAVPLHGRNALYLRSVAYD